jgi:hypothetical protein
VVCMGLWYGEPLGRVHTSREAFGLEGVPLALFPAAASSGQVEPVVLKLSVFPLMVVVAGCYLVLSVCGCPARLRAPAS